jgi:hypothetical protein
MEIMVQTKKSDKNTMVIINLDRPREIRFGHSALKRLAAIFGSNINDLLSKDNFDLVEVEKIMYCGLLKDAREHNEELNLEDMEEILDHAQSYMDLINAMTKALDNAFQETEKQKNL